MPGGFSRCFPTTKLTKHAKTQLGRRDSANIIDVQSNGRFIVKERNGIEAIKWNQIIRD